MHVTIHSRRPDADAVVARCQQLGVAHVCLGLADMPGYKETGVPDRAYLNRFVQRLKDAGIAVPVAIAWFGNDPDVVLKSAVYRKEIEAKLRTLEALGAAGIGVVLHYIDLAAPSDPDDDQRYWDGLLTVFRELVAGAETANVRLANHAIWRCLPDALREDALQRGVTVAAYRAYRMPNWGGPYLLTSHNDIQRLIEAVPSSHDGVCFCTGMHIMGGDIPSLVETFKGKIHYAQMRDLRGRWPAAEEIFLGEGELDFLQILRLLDEAGYGGTIGPEHLGKPRQPSEDLEAAAVRFLHNKLRELPIHAGA